MEWKQEVGKDCVRNLNIGKFKLLQFLGHIKHLSFFYFIKKKAKLSAL